MATGQGQARPPADGNQVDRPYFVHSATRHAQWDKPFSRVAVRLTRAGYQANFAASSLRGLLGFDACLCPAVLSGGERDGRSKPGALGKGGVSGTGEPDVRREYLAQSSPRITWSNFKAVLALVVTGLPGFLLPLLCVCVCVRALLLVLCHSCIPFPPRHAHSRTGESVIPWGVEHQGLFASTWSMCRRYCRCVALPLLSVEQVAC